MISFILMFLYLKNKKNDKEDEYATYNEHEMEADIQTASENR